MKKSLSLIGILTLFLLTHYLGKVVGEFGGNRIFDQALNSASAVTFATVDTGQGANELYDMDQHVLTTSDVTFNIITASERVDTEFLGVTGSSAVITSGDNGYVMLESDDNPIFLQNSIAGSGVSLLGFNVYYDGSNNVYSKTGYAFRISEDDDTGTLTFAKAGSGSAGNTCTLTNAVTIDTAGVLAAVLNGIAAYSRTEAELKALTPSSAGQLFFDSTNTQIVISTAIVVGGFGLITGTGATPTGW